jgi:hypothetical protein
MPVFYFKIVRKEVVTLWGDFVISLEDNDDNSNFTKDTILYKKKIGMSKNLAEMVMRHLRLFFGNGEDEYITRVYVASSDFKMENIVKEFNFVIK